MTETRVISPTGGEKGQKLARFDLIPPAALRQVAELYGAGAAKYGDRNWELGYDWSLNFAAMQRHAWAFWGGEDVDPESPSESPHLAAVVFHALALLHHAAHHPEFDDRPAHRRMVLVPEWERDLWDLFTSPAQEKFTVDPDSGQATPNIVLGGQDA